MPSAPCRTLTGGHMATPPASCRGGQRDWDVRGGGGFGWSGPRAGPGLGAGAGGLKEKDQEEEQEGRGCGDRGQKERGSLCGYLGCSGGAGSQFNRDPQRSGGSDFWKTLQLMRWLCSPGSCKGQASAGRCPPAGRVDGHGHRHSPSPGGAGAGADGLRPGPSSPALLRVAAPRLMGTVGHTGAPHPASPRPRHPVSLRGRS